MAEMRTETTAESETGPWNQAKVIPLVRTETGAQAGIKATEPIDIFAKHPERSEKRVRWLAGIAAGLIAGIFYVFPFSPDLPQLGYMTAESTVPEMPVQSLSTAPAIPVMDSTLAMDTEAEVNAAPIADSGQEMAEGESSDILWNGWRLSGEMLGYHGEARIQSESPVIAVTGNQS
jgi:hypothetical protein